MFGPVIEGERVRLEPPRPESSALFRRWFADMQVTRYLLHRHPPSQRQEETFLEDAAADPHRVLWGIALKDGTEPVQGDWRHRAREDRLAQSRRRERHHDRGHERVASRPRQQCAVFRQDRYVEGGWHDFWLGEILKEEWNALQEKTS